MVLSRSTALAEPMLKPEQVSGFIRAWQEDGNIQARDAIVRAYARLCYRIAAGYSSNPDHIEDLAQEGSFGILRALDRFDPTRGVNFSTYSRFWIQNSIASASADVVNLISVPSRAFIDARMGRLPPGKNDAAVSASQPFVALDAPIGDPDSVSVIDRLACTRPNPHELLETSSSEDNYRSVISAAMASLTDRERAIIRDRRLIDPAKTLEEISESFGVTRERIRQIEMAALEKLQTALKKNGFNPKDHFRN